MTWRSLSQWLKQLRGNTAALYGRISACPLLSEFPPLSLAFFLLILMALPFLINLTTLVKQEGQLLQLKLSQWWEPPRTWAFCIYRGTLLGQVDKNVLGNFPDGPVVKTALLRQGAQVWSGQGTRSHMPQQKILHATIKTYCGQINGGRKKTVEGRERKRSEIKV